MKITENPFFILGASSKDDNQQLINISEEKSLFLDETIINNALNTLASPRKRLPAEIRWFPDLDGTYVRNVLLYIQDIENHKDVSLPCMPSNKNILTDLNINLYTFSTRTMATLGDIRDAILILCRFENSISTSLLKTIINSDRLHAKIPQIQNENEIESELINYRKDIFQTIVARLLRLPQKQYIKIVTMLSDNYLKNNTQENSSIVIDEIFDDYALRMNDEILRKKNEILEMTRYIKNNVTSLKMNTLLNDKISKLKNLIISWDDLVQPLQVAMCKQGQKHNDTIKVANAVRELMLTLHNEYSMTTEALILSNIMKEKFSDLPNLAELFSNDTAALNRMKQQQEEYMRQQAAKQEQYEQEQSKKKLRKYAFIGVAFLVGIFYLSGSSGNKTNNYSSPNNSYSSSSSYSSQADYQPIYEKPSINSNIMTLANLRWSFREEIRIEAMRPRLRSSFAITAFNKQVDAYNYCVNGKKYYKNDYSKAKNEVEHERNNIENEAIRLVEYWNTL